MQTSQDSKMGFSEDEETLIERMFNLIGERFAVFFFVLFHMLSSRLVVESETGFPVGVCLPSFIKNFEVLSMNMIYPPNKHKWYLFWFPPKARSQTAVVEVHVHWTNSDDSAFQSI